MWESRIDTGTDLTGERQACVKWERRYSVTEGDTSVWNYKVCWGLGSELLVSEEPVGMFGRWQHWLRKQPAISSKNHCREGGGCSMHIRLVGLCSQGAAANRLRGAEVCAAWCCEFSLRYRALCHSWAPDTRVEENQGGKCCKRWSSVVALAEAWV